MMMVIITAITITIDAIAMTAITITITAIAITIAIAIIGRTPGLHNKIPPHNIFARVWVAQ